MKLLLLLILAIAPPQAIRQSAEVCSIELEEASAILSNLESWGEGRLYVRKCAAEGCPAEDAYLVSDETKVDPYPLVTGSDGYPHWHDNSYQRTEWICSCLEHSTVEKFTNGACYCGWRPSA